MNVILLGAGLSKRMGRQKLLLSFGDKNVIETVIENLRGAGLTRICAVLSREVASALASHAGTLEVGINEEPERGQSSSLAIGLDMLPEGENDVEPSLDANIHVNPSSACENSPPIDPLMILFRVRRHASLSGLGFRFLPIQSKRA